MSARAEINYNGVFYDDIDWMQDIHDLGPYCPRCGCDGAEGHSSGCEYLWSNMESPRGRTFLKEMIKDALIREGRSLA